MNAKEFLDVVAVGKGTVSLCEAALKEFGLKDFYCWSELQCSSNNKLLERIALTIMTLKAKDYEQWEDVLLAACDYNMTRYPEYIDLAFEKVKEKIRFNDLTRIFAMGEGPILKMVLDWMNSNECDLGRMLPKEYLAGQWVDNAGNFVAYGRPMVAEKLLAYAKGTKVVWEDFLERESNPYLKGLIQNKLETEF